LKFFHKWRNFAQSSHAAAAERQCYNKYNHIFGDFHNFSATKFAIFLQTNAVIYFVVKSIISNKKPTIFVVENIFKHHDIGLGPTVRLKK
jgi:hypothetical protein